ncbi:MAG: 30S ribosomal protein S8 [Patescibacteria group bacterium]|nr:30S ribosomal protein S8 [Patescibacteria group bacterium]
MTDPISDMLTQIRNGLASGKTEVTLPYSKFKFELGRMLAAQGWLEEAAEVVSGDRKSLRLKFKFLNSKPAISGLKRVSTPGQRIYAGADALPRTQGGFGATIVSTSRGLYTDKQARKEHLGGEIICQIW